MTESPFTDSSFDVPVFSPGDDPIAYLNKAMAFLTTIASSSNATSSGGNNASGQARIVKCDNSQGKGHMARQCIQPKRLRNATWYKEKAMLAEAQEAGQILDEEQLSFLADPGVLDGQAVQTIIPNNDAFQNEDLDTYDSDCDDISNAQAVLMANIFNYGSDVISEAQQDSIILSVIEQMSKQMINHVNNWEKANKEQNNESEQIIDSQMDDMIREKLALKEQVDSLEQNLSKQIKERNAYCKHSRLPDDFGKRFTPQQELSAEQLFWLAYVHIYSKPSNDSLFDNVVKIRTTPDARTEERKGIANIATQIPSATTIVLGMFKIDIEPLAPRLLQNREAHLEYLKYTQEQTDILQGIELLVYVRDTCPNAINLSAKKVVVTPKNKVKKVRIKVFDYKKAKIVEFKNANHSEPNHTWGSNATDISSSSSLVMTVRFGNDHIARIMGYGDYQPGNVTILRVYYVEGLGHNLFSVGQFCDGDLEVAFRKNTCFIRNLEGVDLLSRSRDTNLYTISLDDMLKTSPICLLSKASKTKSWLWHRQLSHLNFGTINKLAKDGLARGIPRLKFQKDHLCSACALGKSKKSSHQPKAEDTNQEKLYLLHMDLCGPMRVSSINGKSIWHQTSVARTPQQNNVVERRNQTLVEAARTMLIFSKAPLFLWAEAINTACYTQNRSIIRRRYNKTPYELMQDKKLDLSFFHVFGALCYPTNDNDDLGKLDAKVNIGIFINYAPAKKAFRIYNKRTQKIIETIHVTFDELTTMASEQFSSGPRLYCMTPTTSSSGLVPNLVS
ncbi:integrase, catalytic region, zinc finger, CCHC-type containing protein [Tanacetum coccineum]